MGLDLTSHTGTDHRARLAAEGLAKLHRDTLRRQSQDVMQRNRTLSSALAMERAEIARLQAEVAALRASHVPKTRDVALGHAWQTARDGCALFDPDLVLVHANAAYLSIFDGIDAVRPGIHWNDIFAILLDEGIADPCQPRDDWLRVMRARGILEHPRPATLRLWNGRVVDLVDRRLPCGSLLSLGLVRAKGKASPHRDGETA